MKGTLVSSTLSAWCSFRRACSRIHDEDSGQVSILFVFASIGLVILLALVLNTSQQTARKIQMQGAADAGAVAGAVWTARGMNLMVFDNKGMADILSVMIDVRSVEQTGTAMAAIMAAAATAAAASVFGAWLAPHLTAEAAFWGGLADALDSIEEPLDEFGWTSMRVLDDLNQVIKTTLPLLTEYEVYQYAKKNGADQAVLVSGAGVPPPMFPLARGGKEFLADQAASCCLKLLTGPTEAAVYIACQANPTVIATPPYVCESALLAWPIFEGVAIPSNVGSLGGHPYSSSGSSSPDSLRNQFKDQNGQSIDDRINQINQQNQGNKNYTPKSFSFPSVAYSLLGALSWPDDPPYPMILTDQPSRDPSAQVDATASVDLLVVRRMLQFLALAHASMHPHGILGGDKFVNPTAVGWVTYGQADVYNPTGWAMFNQNWRAKMARATLLTYEAQQLNVFGSSSIFSLKDQFVYLNTH